MLLVAAVVVVVAAVGGMAAGVTMARDPPASLGQRVSKGVGGDVTRR